MKTVKGMPAAVVRYALIHQIRLGRKLDTDGSVDFYYVADHDGRIVEATRTTKPKACHAIAMMQRYLRASA